MTSLDAFDAECSVLAGVLGTLATEAFARPTNCPPWNLHELVVHIAFSVRMPDELPLREGEARPAADYYRRTERRTEEYRAGNVDRTREIAATIPAGRAPALFGEVWTRTSALFARHDAGCTMIAAGMVLTIEQYVLTRLMSVAAHGVDVAVTLGRPPWTTPQALAAVRPVLADLLGTEPPREWSDQDLLEIGTGRRPVANDPRFPLLS